MENKNQLVVAESISKEKLLNYLKIANVASKLTEQEKLNFIEIAQAYQLNPFKREIYCNCYGSGDNRTTSIITGYEVYIKRAERTGKLDGWKPEVVGNIKDGTLKGKITIYRKDWREPFVHEVYFEEVCQRKKDGQLNAIWSKMPRFMTKKVAIAQGFRLCFSDELGGMPYTADELPQQEESTQVVQAEVVEESKPKIEKELPEEDLNLINSCSSKEAMIQVCAGIKKKLGDDYYRAITIAYKNRLAELGK